VSSRSSEAGCKLLYPVAYLLAMHLYAWLGDLESLAESARFLLLLSTLCQQQSRYEDRLSFMTKAKEVQEKSVSLCHSNQ